MQLVLVVLLEEPDVFHSLSLQVRALAGHVQGKLPGTLKVVAQKVVKDLHVRLLLEEHVIGQVLEDLQQTRVYSVNLYLEYSLATYCFQAKKGILDDPTKERVHIPTADFTKMTNRVYCC